jgi:hypothetical protein
VAIVNGLVGVWWGLADADYALSRVFPNVLCYNRGIGWGNSIGRQRLARQQGFFIGDTQMAKQNFTPIQQVFADADAESLSFADRLLSLGIASRSEAKPHAMEWACMTHEGCKIIEGRQGNKLTDTSAERAMNRVLSICYPSSDKPVRTQKRTANKTDEVAKLIKAYAKLTGAEKRRFKSSI